MSFRQRFGIAWRLLRPFTLTASIAPGLVGTGLAISTHSIHWMRFAAFMLASVLIQSATNMFNEYFDYKRGLDTKEMVGIAGTIVHDNIHPKRVLAVAWTFIGVSVLLGVYLCMVSSWWIALIGSVSMSIAYFYSGGPKPLSYTPFGEIAAAVAMGPVIVLLAFYIQTEKLTLQAGIASIPIGLLIGAILLGNNIRDMEQDRVGGRRTVPILLGRPRATVLFASVFATTYIIVLALIGVGVLSLWALATLLTIPSAFYVAKLFFQFAEPSKLHPAVKGTAALLFHVGLILFVAQLIPLFVPTTVL